MRRQRIGRLPALLTPLMTIAIGGMICSLIVPVMGVILSVGQLGDEQARIRPVVPLGLPAKAETGRTPVVPP